VLGNRASVLFPDVLWSELNVDQRGLNLCMPHELHQRREASQAVIVASTSSESRVQTGARLRETHASWHARRSLPDD